MQRLSYNFKNYIRCAYLVILFFISILVFLPEAISSAANAARSTSGKSIETSRIPLYFNPQENNVDLGPLELDFKYRDAEKKSFQIGPFLIDENTFNFKTLRSNEMDSSARNVLGLSSIDGSLILAQWPEHMISEGTLQVISMGSGKVLSDFKFDLKSLQSWAQRKKKIKSSAKSDSIIASSQAGFIIEKKTLLRWTAAQPFRFCIVQNSNQDEQLRASLCSRQYGLRNSTLATVKAQGRARILLNEQEIQDPKSFVVQDRAHFFIESANGITYDFLAKPVTPLLRDLSFSDSDQKVTVVGHDLFPLSNYEILNPEEGSVSEALGLQATMGDLRKNYYAETNAENNQAALYFPGSGGGVFKQNIDTSKLPPVEARIYLAEDNIKATYIENPLLFGIKDENFNVESDQLSVSTRPSKPTQFTWKFQAKKRGQLNSSVINVSNGKSKYKVNYELYRGYSNELSGRFSAVTAGDSVVVIAEASYSHWFENIFGSENKTFSRQRWGVNTRLFRSLAKIPTIDRYNFDTAEIRYRLKPGLWSHDETVGIMAVYQNVAYGSQSSSMAGGGVFWARSMPRFLDKLLSALPLLGSQKWVHLEALYYPSPMTNKTTLGSNYTLNLYGQILWTERFFGEGGFSYKKYDFTDKSSGDRVDIGILFGTAGLGYKF